MKTNSAIKFVALIAIIFMSMKAAFCKVNMEDFDSVDTVSSGYSIVTKAGKKGLACYEKIVVPVEYDDIQPTEKKGSFILTKDGKKGLACGSKIFAPVEYDDIQIAENQSWDDYYRHYFLLIKDGKKGLAYNGKLLIPAEYDDIQHAEEMCTFILTKDGKMGLAYDGSIVVPVEYDDILSTKNGRHVILIKDGKMGLAYDGSIVVPTEYDNIQPTKSDYVSILIKDGKKGLVLGDSIVVPLKYNTVQIGNDLIFAGLMDKKIDIYDMSTREPKIITFQFPFNDFILKDKISCKDGTFITFQSGKKYGFYDIDKKKFSKKLYSGVKTRDYDAFVPISGEVRCLMYKEYGIWHNYDKTYKFKRIALAPVEIPLSIIHDVIILPCDILTLRLFSHDYYTTGIHSSPDFSGLSH